VKVVSHVTDTVTPTVFATPDLAELERVALESALVDRGEGRFRARQIFGWIYRRGVTDLEAMTDLPKELRASLAAAFRLTTPQISTR